MGKRISACLLVRLNMKFKLIKYNKNENARINSTDRYQHIDSCLFWFFFFFTLDTIIGIIERQPKSVQGIILN